MATAKPTRQNPADVARETFRQLSVSRTQPTPDAYRKVYNDIAGIADDEGGAADTAPANQDLESILRNFAASLSGESREFAMIGEQLAVFASQGRWLDYQKGLNEFITRIFAQIKALQVKSDEDAKAAAVLTPAEAQKQESVLKDLLTRTLALALPSLLTTAPELSQESDALAKMLKSAKTDKELVDIGSRLKTLCFRIENLRSEAPAAGSALPASLTDDPLIPMLSQLLSRTLNMAVSSLLHNDAKLVTVSDQLAREVQTARTLTDFQRVESGLKDLFYKISLKGDDNSEQLQLLLSLFRLLLENVSALLEDDNWLRGQVEVVQELIAGELDYRSLMAATKGLKEVIYKQGVLKDSIAQNRMSVKQLMDLFVERLSLFASATGAYHEKIATYSGKISPETSPEEINQVIDALLADTLQVQSEAKQSFDMMQSAQQEVRDAEARIHDLEQKLAELSDQVQKDQLTGSLNRRGLDEMLDREVARADRRQTPLCFGMLDIDNFKKLNDTYGHAAGDGALIHLVNVIKRTLRSMDVIARYGGEEFAIIMPETSLKDAADTMMRVQRELTKHFFMAGEDRILITFSAGVAERRQGEELQNLIIRADKAMYQAKTSGKNRVATAE